MISTKFDLVYKPGDSYKKLCYLLTFSDLAIDFLNALKDHGQIVLAQYLDMSQSRLSTLKIMVEIAQSKNVGNSVLIFYVDKSSVDVYRYSVVYNPKNYIHSDLGSLVVVKDIRLLTGMAEFIFKELTHLDEVIVNEPIWIKELDVDALLDSLEPYRNDIV